VGPRVEGEGDEDVGVGQVVFERPALVGGQRFFVAVQMAHKIALVMAGHAVAEDVVVHASANIDRIDLHVAEVSENGGDVGGGLIERHGMAVKTPGQQR